MLFQKLLFLLFHRLSIIWGKELNPIFQFNTTLLKNNANVSIDQAIFRNEAAFKPGNLYNHAQFWETVILKDHPHKDMLLRWLPGIDLEEFLNSHTKSSFQNIQINAKYPQEAQFENYVPEQFTDFMNKNYHTVEKFRSYSKMGPGKTKHFGTETYCSLSLKCRTRKAESYLGW